MWTSNYPLAHFVEIGGGDRFGEGQFASKDRRDSNFVWLDINIR